MSNVNPSGVVNVCARPPTSGFLSIRMTSYPSFCSSHAAVSPENPAPMTAIVFPRGVSAADVLLAAAGPTARARARARAAAPKHARAVMT